MSGFILKNLHLNITRQKILHYSVDCCISFKALQPELDLWFFCTHWELWVYWQTCAFNWPTICTHFLCNYSAQTIKGQTQGLLLERVTSKRMCFFVFNSTFHWQSATVHLQWMQMGASSCSWNTRISCSISRMGGMESGTPWSGQFI